jgi:hypothetical protein
MKKIVLILLISITTKITAQHCPFDNTGLLVVNVVMEKGHLNQLRILKPILTYIDNQNEEVSVPFKLNLYETDYYSWKINHYNASHLRFDFAKNYFVVSVPISDCKNLTIHLEDEKGKIVVEKKPIKKDAIYDLHKNYGHNWSDFGNKDTIPKPKNEFDKLITITVTNIEELGTLLFKAKPSLYHKYKYKNRIIFDNQKDLDDVIMTYFPENQKIDFNKYMVIYQAFSSDCHMRVKIFKYINDKEKTIIIRSLVLYGGCRASGRRTRLSVIDRPPKGYKLLFENIKEEDYMRNNFFWD